ncbi:DUF447 domain-containing protein [Methylococcus geothermalis]|uniref:DUF447 family protein n=1 Tax=Methylococcus geothermalis TaxID=2681310 RepID=A0A858Q8L3_9GAMM|nr:DUF447 domain-containing protein [Methylococcus geothermalis]QJD30242.1 DUF447 family protein [Methylococcus geothermalis]
MIRETLVTTATAGGAAHIAPMGIHAPDTDSNSGGAEYLIMPFRPSQTLENALASGCAVVNYSDDVRIFAGCLTGRRDWPLVPAERVSAQRLNGTLAHAELELSRVEDDPERPRLYFRVVHEANHAPFRGFNRAQFAVLEAAILVSRLHFLPWSKIERELDYLRIGLDKTAGPRELEAWNWLMEAVEAHRPLAGEIE